MRTTFLGYHYRDFTFGKILADKARKNGAKTFLTYLPDGRKLTYSDIHCMSNAIANSLLADGLGKGTHVAMLMENSPEQILSFFALGKLGAVAVPINAAVRGEFLQYYLNQSDSTALIVDASLLGGFVEIAPNTNISRVYVVGNDGVGVPADDCKFRNFKDLLNADVTAPDIEVAYSDLCCLNYTSGTTGPSKGNMFPQIHMLTFGAQQIDAFRLCADDVYYIWMPLYHVGAYGGALMSCLLVDASIALTKRLSAQRFLRDVRESGATAAMLLSVGEFILAQPPSSEDRNHRLRFAIATPMPHNALEFERRFGFHLTQGYGLSDFSLAFTQTLDEPADKRSSIGRVMEDVQARIVDDEDVDVPIGEVGEIVLRKDWLPCASSQGYYKMPDKTVAAMRNLWFHTGDRGRLDKDGYFYFVDRKKDAIRRRGENISAYEVEVAIAKHAAVMEVAAFPAAVGRGDEEVAACIVLKPEGKLTEIELIEHCAASMPYYMVPRFVEFRDSLPRTTTQKIQKYLLKQQLEEDFARAWDRERAGVVLRR